MAHFCCVAGSVRVISERTAACATFMLEKSGRQEESRARAAIGFLPVLMDVMSVTLVRGVCADGKRPMGPFRSLVVERIGFVLGYIQDCRRKSRTAIYGRKKRLVM